MLPFADNHVQGGVTLQIVLCSVLLLVVIENIYIYVNKINSLKEMLLEPTIKSGLSWRGLKEIWGREEHDLE